MSRPIKRDADYVAHSAHLRNAKEIKALRSRYGPEGYSLYWMLLETLTGIEGHRLEWCDLQRELVAGDLGATPEVVANLVTYCIVLKLFYLEEEVNSDGLTHYLRSRYIEEKLGPLYAKRKADRERRDAKAAVGSAKQISSQDPPPVIAAITTDIAAITPDNAAITTQSKAKQSKAKEEDINIKSEEEILSEERNILAEVTEEIRTLLIKHNSIQVAEWEAAARRYNIDVVTLQKQFCNTVIIKGSSRERLSLIAGFDRYLTATISNKQNEESRRDKNPTRSPKRSTRKNGQRGGAAVAADTSQPKTGGYKL